jgi:hypothetical protein
MPVLDGSIVQLQFRRSGGRVDGGRRPGGVEQALVMTHERARCGRERCAEADRLR